MHCRKFHSFVIIVSPLNRFEKNKKLIQLFPFPVRSSTKVEMEKSVIKNATTEFFTATSLNASPISFNESLKVNYTA